MVLGFILTAQVFGQLEGNPENLCRNGFFPRDGKEYNIAKIKGAKGEKVYFYGDEREDCPKNKNCRLKSYVIPGDEVIVSRDYGDFACAWFQPRKGSETVGWIELDKIERVETNRQPAQNEFLGDWRFYDNSIVISKSRTAGLFDVKGDAVWKGFGGNVHVGELDESVKSTGNLLKLGENDTDEFACKASLLLVGRFLIVADNLNCGGANVTFSGVYQKRQAK